MLKEYGIKDKNNVEEVRTIELGHIFQLGTKYSESMKATYINNEGKEEVLQMGCYGIGISRTVATIYEESVLKDKDGNSLGISLPISIAPYLLQIVPKIENEEKFNLATKIYDKLQEKGIDVILDDRKQGMLGAKIKDCKMLGTPYMLIIGDKQEEGQFEIECTATGEREILDENQLIEKFVNLKNSRKYV